MRTATWIVILLVAASVVAGLLLFRESTPDYLFLITLDTTRADRIDYSKTNPNTPNISHLAADGMAFKNAFSLIPITLPSHHAMFHSLPPHQLKIYNNGQRVQVTPPSITRVFKDNGYQTGAVISLGVLKKDFGLSEGFDYYVENFKRSLWHKSAAEVNREARGVIRNIKDSGKKGFIWLHYSDPHSPYFPPESGGVLNVMGDTYDITQEPLVKQTLVLKPGENSYPIELELPGLITEDPRLEPQYFELFNAEIGNGSGPGGIELKLPPKWRQSASKDKIIYRFHELHNQLVFVNHGSEDVTVEFSFVFKIIFPIPANRLLYKQSIVYMDREIGKLTDFLKAEGIYQRSAFVLVGDHGEGLGEHKFYFGHIHYLNKNYVHVPLIVSGPAIEKKGIRDEAVSTLDVAPTLLRIAGIKPPDSMTGQSLLGEIKAKRILLETYSPEALDDSFSIIEYPLQVIYTPGGQKPEERPELYNLALDPHGNKNLFYRKDYDKAKGPLYNAIRKLSRVLMETKGEIGQMSEKHKEILETLGYF